VHISAAPVENSLARAMTDRFQTTRRALEIVAASIAAVRGRGLKVVLPEANDTRILRSAQQLSKSGIAVPVLLAAEAGLATRAASLGWTWGGAGCAIWIGPARAGPTLLASLLPAPACVWGWPSGCCGGRSISAPPCSRRGTRTRWWREPPIRRGASSK